jgi:hypothetical protein
MRETTFLAAVFLMLAIAVHTQSAPRWAAGASISVWIDRANAPAGASALVERAVTTWAAAVGKSVGLRPSRIRDGAAVRVRFAGSRGLYGETRPQIDPATGAIVSADVVIATDTGGDDPVTQRIVLYLTALHELGHALGLRHTDNFADIMYAFRRPDDGERYFAAYRRQLRTPDEIGSPAASGLSANDLAAVRKLYGR